MSYSWGKIKSDQKLTSFADLLKMMETTTQKNVAAVYSEEVIFQFHTEEKCMK